MATHPTVELQVGTTWTDITAYVRHQDRIRITRGRSAEASQFSTSTCTMTLDNRDGRFSPRNPTGAYYGQIGRNTPVRVSIDGGLTYLDCPGESGGRASTPDTAALDITGDIDIRVEMFLLDWNVTDDFTEILGKYLTTGNQRSWRMYLVAGGYPAIQWTADGSTGISATSTTALATNGRSRMAVRVTIDVDNDAGGNTVTFYTADDIDGEWTQLGNAVTATGTTSIFSSTANLQVGDIETSSLTPLTGRIYAVQVLDGIDGTAAADVDFTTQTVGDTSFTGDDGLTWTVTSPATLSNRSIRFTGEVSSWPVDWDISGQDVTTQIEAAGIVRRLTQSDSPLRSPMFRDLTNPERTGILAYWPLEDASTAASFASGIPGNPPMTYTGTPTLATSSTWVGSANLPTMGTATLTAPIPSYTTTGVNTTQFIMQVPSGGVAAETTLFTLFTTGTARTWKVSVNTGGSLKVSAYDSEGVELLGAGYINFAVNGKKEHILFDLVQDGSDVDYQLLAFNYTSAALISETISGGATSGTATGKTLGRITRITMGDGGLGDTVIGHIAVSDNQDAFNFTGQAILGIRGEAGTNRLRRLVETEEGIPLQIHSRAKTGNVVTMGAQGLKDIVDLVREVEETDLGILYEPRDEIGIAYRTRLSLYDQPVSLTLDYSQNELSGPPIPVDDDRYTRNDITVTRENGSFYRSVLEEGPLSVQAPPNGVGRYDESLTISLGTDAQLGNQSYWRLHLGTVDEARYPQISLNLRHTAFTSSASKTNSALTLEVGDRITLSNPPSWIPPDSIDLLVIGFTETYGAFERDIIINCVPASSYNVATSNESTARADTGGSSLTSAINSTETAVSVTTDDGSAVWIDSSTYPSEFPFDVKAGGEVMTVTACDPPIRDAFGRTSSSSWGTADSGQTWSNSGGTSADYNVTGGYGSHRLATVNASRRTFFTTPLTDIDVSVSMTPSATATGGYLSGGLAARYIDNDNLYTARLAFNSTGSMTLTLRKRVTATETELATSTLPFNYTAGTYYRMRFQVLGTTLRARAWLASAREPNTWDVSTTDSSLSSTTYFGVRSIAATTNTNVNPEIRYDDLRVNNPQTFTVTRSTNGVVKSHSAGTAVRLSRPTYVAL